MLDLGAALAGGAGQWVVPEPFRRLRCRVERAPGEVRIRAFMDNAEPAAWVVPRREAGRG